MLRYIRGTTSYGIKYSSYPETKLIRYSDSVWEGSVDDMKSTSGYTFSLGFSVFSWCSMKK